LDLLNKTQYKPVQQFNRPNSAAVRLIGGKLVKMNNENNNHYNYDYNKNIKLHNEHQSTIEIRNIIDLLLLDTWYIVEYINNNNLIMSLSTRSSDTWKKENIAPLNATLYMNPNTL
jgi:hypothetical protein